MKKQVSFFTLITLIILASLIYVLKIIETPSAPEKSQRIISIGGALTEVIYALKANNHLVGTDTTSYFPKEAEDLPKVGYERALSIEGVLSLNPNLIFLTDKAGPPRVLKQLEKTKIKIIKLSNDPPSINNVKNNIKTIAYHLDLKKEGEKLIKSIENDLEKLKKKIAKQAKPIRVLFIFGHGHITLVAGKNTAADKIIEISGAKNVIDYFGYKPLTPEAILALKPDFIIFASRGKDKDKFQKILSKIPGLSLTKAVLENKIILIDTLFALGFGPRVAQAALELNNHYLEINN